MSMISFGMEGEVGSIVKSFIISVTSWRLDKNKILSCFLTPGDSCDVTLLTEDQRQFRAHKVWRNPCPPFDSTVIYEDINVNKLIEFIWNSCVEQKSSLLCKMILKHLRTYFCVYFLFDRKFLLILKNTFSRHVARSHYLPSFE